jgi:hypothetical protein
VLVSLCGRFLFAETLWLVVVLVLRLGARAGQWTDLLDVPPMTEQTAQSYAAVAAVDVT